MNRPTCIILSCCLVFAFVLVLPRSALSSAQQQGGTPTGDQGFWRLDKVTPKNTQVKLQPGQEFSASDGFVSASSPFVKKVDYGGDTTGTNEGTNSWDSPPLMLSPGMTYNTTLGATSNITVVNGNANATHQTDFWLGTEKIGSVRAFSEANSGGPEHNTGEVKESKTITWTVKPGTFNGERFAITVAAATCLGFTVSFTYEYVWQPTAINELIPTQVTQATVITPEIKRELTVTGYDGSDTYHTPLTFLIQAKEDGKPLANEPLYLQFAGDVKCLMNRYAIWDEASKSWKPGTANLANDEQLQTTTDSNGQVTLRALLDFYQMNQQSVSLPCAETLKAEIAKKPGDQMDRIKAENAVTIRYPIYIQNVFFRAEKDPQFSPSQWIRIGMIDNEYRHLVMAKNYNGRASPAYPETRRILERVTVNGQVFQPPADDRDYYSPVSAGSTLEINLCNHGENYYAEMLPDDGIAVFVMWMDGTEAVFAQRNQDVETECRLVVKFDPRGWLSNDVDLTPAQNTWTRFMINQAGDVIVKAGLVAGVTFFGGPVAGAWTAVLVESLQTAGDVNEIIKIDLEHRMIVVHSEVSITSTKDGLTTLYNFEGSPAVFDGKGNKAAPAPGEALDFRLTGPLGTPEKRDPPGEISGLKAIIAPEPGPVAPTFEELGLTHTPVANAKPDQEQQTRVWIFLCVGALLLAAVIGLVIVLIILWQRSRAAGQPPALPYAPQQGGNKRVVWLGVGIAAICLLCVVTAGVIFFILSARPDLMNKIGSFPDSKTQAVHVSITQPQTPENTPAVQSQSAESLPVEPQAPPTATVVLPTAALAPPTAASSSEEEFFAVRSDGAANTGATAPTKFTIAEPWLVTAITTYHWNNAQGVAAPGTIGLKAANGELFGPWQATGTPGQGGIPNTYWLVNPNIVIPAGDYTVIDSDPATWSQNEETAGAGMAWGEGIRQNKP